MMTVQQLERNYYRLCVVWRSGEGLPAAVWCIVQQLETAMTQDEINLFNNDREFHQPSAVETSRFLLDIAVEVSQLVYHARDRVDLEVWSLRNTDLYPLVTKNVCPCVICSNK